MMEEPLTSPSSSSSLNNMNDAELISPEKDVENMTTAENKIEVRESLAVDEEMEEDHEDGVVHRARVYLLSSANEWLDVATGNCHFEIRPVSLS